MKRILIYFFLIFILNGNNITDQVEVMILSKNVGTEIDVHENRFYRIFPKEKGLINAQIIRINDSQYRLLIVKKVDGMETKVRRYLTSNEFDELKKYVNDHGLVYLDYFSLMVDQRRGLNKDYTYDGVHPNQDGYILMSSLAEKVLSRLLH